MSIWKTGITMPTFESLSEDLTVGTLIIGGGLAGLSCGRFLKEQGEDYALVEKEKIAGGMTEKTTAKITAGHGLIYSRLIKEQGVSRAAAYLAANLAALDLLKQDAARIDCDFETCDNYIYALDPADKRILLAETEAINTLGGQAEYTEEVKIPLKCAGAVRMGAQAQFHPLKYAAAIAEGQRIFERSTAEELDFENGAYAVQVQGAGGKKYRIRAKKVIVCTHFPYLNRKGLYFMKLYQQRSYVLSLKGDYLPALDGMYMGNHTGDLSFRTAKGSDGKPRILIGGCGGRTGKRCGGFAELKEDAALLFPGAQTEDFWWAQDCMSLDGIPYIGAYGRGGGNLLVASGFNKWGMTGSVAASMILTGRLTGALADVFQPVRKGRSMFCGQLFFNIFESGKNLLCPAPKRCTHMGCALKWNEEARTWDCGCHGSVFDEKGKILSNPAGKNLADADTRN